MTPNSLPSTLDHERGPRQKLSFLQTQAKPILDNFIHHLQDRYPDYNTLSRDQLRYELQDFINQEYGGNLLSSFKNGLITGESMDFTMDQFLDQSFSLDNALDLIKGMTIAQTINNTNSEQTIMTKGLETLYHQRNKQPDAVRAQLPLEDFLHSRGYLLQKDATGNLINISAGSHVQPDNINTLKEAFSSFVIAHTNDQAIRDLYTQMLQFDQADLTEKVVAVTTVRSLMEKIEQLFAQDPARL